LELEKFLAKPSIAALTTNCISIVWNRRLLAAGTVRFLDAWKPTSDQKIV
jgi:hypothetical protein